MQPRVEAFEVLPVDDGPTPRGGILGRGRVLALRVRDSSMADEGIREGDYLLVQPGDAEAGQTVVAEVDGAYTVKRLVRGRSGRVCLRSASPDRPAVAELTADQVRIVGAVVGVFRRQGFRTTTPHSTPVALAEGHTLDLALHAIGQALRAAEARVAEGSVAVGGPLRELARSLRALRDCYLETSTPRLREALLREAEGVMAALRRFGVEPRAGSA